MGHAVTWLVHPYGFRIDGEREYKFGARAERVQKPDSGYVAPVKGLGDLTSGRSGTSMPISYSAAVRDGDDHSGRDRVLAGAKSLAKS